MVWISWHILSEQISRCQLLCDLSPMMTMMVLLVDSNDEDGDIGDGDWRFLSINSVGLDLSQHHWKWPSPQWGSSTWKPRWGGRWWWGCPWWWSSMWSWWESPAPCARWTTWEEPWVETFLQFGWMGNGDVSLWSLAAIVIWVERNTTASDWPHQLSWTISTKQLFIAFSSFELWATACGQCQRGSSLSGHKAINEGISSFLIVQLKAQKIRHQGSGTINRSIPSILPLLRQTGL